MKNPKSESDFSKKNTNKYNGKSGELNWNLITSDFLKAFNKLPILYETNGFKFRNIRRELSRDNDFIDYFISNFSDEVCNHFDRIWENESVYGKIEIECYASNFLTEEQFDERLKECFLNYDDEDNELYGSELFKKYPTETKKLLDDMGKIIEIMWDESFYFLQDHEFFTKSLFISLYIYEYSIPYEDWIEIEKQLIQ